MDNVSMVLIQEVKGHMSVDDQGVNWLSIHHARILFSCTENKIQCNLSL